MGNVNVTVLVPDSTVESMLDEIADHSVEAAVNAALAAYGSIDSDGEIPLVTYDSDFDNGLAVAKRTAEDTEGADLIVIVSDLECDDRDRAERLLNDLAADGNFVVIVPVSNQGFDEKWAKRLDDDIAAKRSVDVVTVAGLGNPTVALDEVAGWANSVA